jgi:hypothetical protein
MSSTYGEEEMKPIATSVLMLSMALIFVSCENGSQLTQSTLDVETQLSKGRPHPNKPRKAELIAFVGDLKGSQTVVGCCPNAGPFPAYTMTLSGPLLESLPAGPHDGQIFMNTVGSRRANRSYMVQFWTETMFLEVRGGVIQEDKKNKSLTATYTNQPMTIYLDGEPTDPVDVNFTLTRAQQ